MNWLPSREFLKYTAVTLCFPKFTDNFSMVNIWMNASAAGIGICWALDQKFQWTGRTHNLFREHYEQLLPQWTMNKFSIVSLFRLLYSKKYCNPEAFICIKNCLEAFFRIVLQKNSENSLVNIHSTSFYFTKLVANSLWKKDKVTDIFSTFFIVVIF